jgi:ABC-type nitrate/sulfonate/bicarbonate transport system permease component
VSRRVRALLLEIWFPIAAFVLWWQWSANSTSFYYPPLRDILEVTRDTWVGDRFFEDLVPSMRNFVVGFFLAAVIGVVLGVILGISPLLRKASAPTVDFLRSIPPPALISVLIVLLGFETTMKVSAITFASTFPVLLNTIDGVRAVDAQQLDMASAYRLRFRDRIFRIVLPGASPQIFAGLRVALAVAIAVMVFSEMFAGTDGLGFFIIFAQQTYRIPDMYSGIIVIGLLGYAANLVFMIAERRVLRWHHGWRSAGSTTGE